MREPEFVYNEETGVTIATIFYKDMEFCGEAVCAPDDRDMMNRKTGETIALIRAEINYLCHVRDNELIPTYNAIRNLHFSLIKNKNYDEHSLEARRIRRHMYMHQSDLAAVQKMIKGKKIELREYFDAKDELYKKLRKDKRG